ncbi:MAG TPA: hypothetical protein VF873_05610 [Gemmatimonadales bacterium]
MKLASIGGLTLLLATFACRDVSTDLARRDAIDATPMFAAAATPTTVFRFMSRGDFGSVSWNSNSQFGFANISTGDTLGLFYQVAQFDPCCSFATGSGPVPTSDITGSGVNKLILNTNTCTDPGFTTFEGPCGMVSIEFDRTSFFTGRSQGTSSQKFGTITFQSTGTSEGSSAEATGTVVGFPITAPNFGQMGTNRNMQISIIRE